MLHEGYTNYVTQEKSPFIYIFSSPPLSGPPPTPRIRPVVTDVITSDMSVSSSPQRSQSPMLEGDFTFSCPVVPDSVPSPPHPQPGIHQFRFASVVPGVTKISKGGNVEPELMASIEDTPEFIVNWNQNKTKRFRPVAPTSRRIAKKRRISDTDLSPI
ncbi:hypothetical protein BDF21DRAFT_393810 [Thamnidium elegans]|nr:hypothetical protein BDF21DRAFT_393810 [Thamnidium elegans]